MLQKNSHQHNSYQHNSDVQPAHQRVDDAVRQSDPEQWRYQAILEDQTELICRYLPDTTILYVNDAFCRYFGLDKSSLIGKSYIPVIYEADREKVSDLVSSMNDLNPRVLIENRVIANGEIRWTQWNSRCFYDEQGQVIECQSVGQDITQLKETEIALRESELRYRMLINTIPQLVWVAKADGLTRIDYNQRWYDYTGQTPETVTADYWLTAIHPDDVSVALSQWEKATLSGENFEAQYRLRRSDGVYLWHLAKAEPERDGEGKVVRWYGTCTDISVQKHHESEQQKAEGFLHHLNETLEVRVVERTHALVVANAALQQEICERQQAEANLKLSEERFRRAIVEAPFPIFIHSESGEILQISRAVSEITGYAESEIRTLTDWTTRVYGANQDNVLAGINRLYQLNHRVDEGAFEVITKSGETRIWFFSSAPLGQLPTGTKLVISMAADITELTQAREHLASRIRQQVVLTQLSQAALSGIDLSVLMNEAVRLVAQSLQADYCKILELMPDGRSLILRSGVGWQSGLVGVATVGADLDSQAGYTLSAQQPVVVEDMATESRFRGPQLLIDHAVVSGMSTIIWGPQEKAYGVLGVHSTQRRDFSQDDINFLQSVANLLAAVLQRKQAEADIRLLNQTLEQRVQDRTQALEEANQELEAFSYSVAHDLRAPLRAIQGFAQVLHEDYYEELDDLGNEYIHRMSTSAEYLDVMIQDLLTYSQLGRTEMYLQQVSLASTFEHILVELEPIIQEKQVEIKIASELPLICAQRSVLRQIILNLVQNAVKFVAPGVQPRVKVWSEYSLPDNDIPSDYVRIWIEDNGIGIDPKHQERIFNAFERLHGIEAYPGTGIGLAIVKRGVARLRGKVGVVSALNQGSRFWIDLLLVCSPL